MSDVLELEQSVFVSWWLAAALAPAVVVGTTVLSLAGMALLLEGCDDRPLRRASPLSWRVSDPRV